MVEKLSTLSMFCDCWIMVRSGHGRQVRSLFD